MFVHQILSLLEAGSWARIGNPLEYPYTKHSFVGPWFLRWYVGLLRRCFEWMTNKVPDSRNYRLKKKYENDKWIWECIASNKYSKNCKTCCSKMRQEHGQTGNQAGCHDFASTGRFLLSKTSPSLPLCETLDFTKRERHVTCYYCNPC